LSSILVSSNLADYHKTEFRCCSWRSAGCRGCSLRWRTVGADRGITVW